MDAADPSHTLDDAAEHRRRALALTALAAILDRFPGALEWFLGIGLPPAAAGEAKPRPAWLRGVVAGGFNDLPHEGKNHLQTDSPAG